MLKIQFLTPYEYIADLKQDLENVKNDFGLPCEITPDFTACGAPVYPESVAVAFYEEKQIKQGFPEIEVNPPYYDLHERKLTLLHEIIHACQRTSSLEFINRDYLVSLIDRLHVLEKGFSSDDHFNLLISNKIQVIYMFSTWVLEIWDEMYLKTKYPHLYIQKLEQTHDIISQELDSIYDGYGKWEKYALISHVVRSKYLQKITSGTKIESKFKNLYNKWKLRLQNCVDVIEFQRLMSKVDDLSNIDTYMSNDPTSLKNSYEDMIQEMLENYNNQNVL